MSDGKFLKCICVHCGGHIEFPADGIGATIPCPHCAQETELTLETSPNESASSQHGKKWIIAGAIILSFGMIGAIGALVVAKILVKKTQGVDITTQSAARDVKRNATSEPPAASPSGNIMNDFEILPVTIDKKPGSSLVYATGTLRNDTDKQRFGVTVEIDLLDGAGTKIGSAKDYKDRIEPRGEWTFRALLVVPNVAAARVSTVREQ